MLLFPDLFLVAKHPKSRTTQHSLPGAVIFSFMTAPFLCPSQCPVIDIAHSFLRTRFVHVSIAPIHLPVKTDTGSVTNPSKVIQAGGQARGRFQYTSSDPHRCPIHVPRMTYGCPYPLKGWNIYGRFVDADRGESKLNWQYTRSIRPLPGTLKGMLRTAAVQYNQSQGIALLVCILYLGAGYGFRDQVTYAR
jgi:hypothetical protein